MPILTQDIKLLKSAVMADTTDGGGAMTGIEVIDGQSNNLFPDTSALDRAFGRVNMRKVFGVAHTLDTDTLLGAHAIISDAPNDPLVHCSLINTTGWADTRDAARDAIEKYLVKGPRSGPVLYDAHYQGGLQIRLISFVEVPFPQAGDALVLRTNGGDEQFVRLLKTVQATQQVAVFENNSVQVFTATVATCDLGQPLAFDFFGPPAGRLVPNGFAQVFTTSTSVGAKFYGIKPLAVAGAPGDLTVRAAGGIFTPLVPASTVETAIIDQFGMAPVSQLTFTSTTTVTLDSSSVTLAPNRTLNFPTAIRPGSVNIVAAGLTFTDDSAGKLIQSGATVGTVDYKLGLVTFASSAPYNTTVNAVASYVPASLTLATSNSSSLTITTGNQGSSFTNVFEPLPAPGSLSLSYMAQGRWYELRDNANGRLSGDDASYGTGSINYTTGSMAVTFGAQPDVDSQIIANWGTQSAAVPAPAPSLPAKANLLIPLLAGATTADMTLAWENGATPYTATLGATGLLTGDATGSLVNGNLIFEPNIFPTGNILLNYKRASASVSASFTGSAGLYQITSALPVTPNTLRFNLAIAPPGDMVAPVTTLAVFDFQGRLFTVFPGKLREDIGAVNYATGEIALNPSLTADVLVNEIGLGPTFAWGQGGPGATVPLSYRYTVNRSRIFALSGSVSSLTYSTGAAVAATPISFTPTTWTARVNAPGAELGTGSLSFTLGNQKYSVKDGNVVQNWSFGTAGGATLVAGTVSGSGLININPANLPLNRVNSMAFGNVPVNLDPGKVSSGIFRILSAPVKTGVLQLQSGALVGTANDSGVITGGGFTGQVDFSRGVVRWANTEFLDPATLSYNAVLLQYLPLDGALLGLNTERLPLDGKVPIYRKSDLLVVHNTLSTALPNPLTKNTAYPLGRVRLASVRVKDALGAVVPDTLYEVGLNPGTLTVPTAANITPYTQPLTVEHRIEDMVICTQADISGALKLTRSLTHNFPADTSFVSSAMPFGDLFARAFNFIDQVTWTGAWKDTLIGDEALFSYNFSNYPLEMTNKGAIEERWALIFTNNTSFRIIGEFVGEVGVGNINTVTSPNNPAVGVPFFTIPILGWGGGRGAGNVLRFNTEACGAPFWPVRTTLQGPASLDSDQFTIAFRGDVDRP